MELHIIHLLEPAQSWLFTGQLVSFTDNILKSNINQYIHNIHQRLRIILYD